MSDGPALQRAPDPQAPLGPVPGDASPPSQTQGDGAGAKPLTLLLSVLFLVLTLVPLVIIFYPSSKPEKRSSGEQETEKAGAASPGAQEPARQTPPKPDPARLAEISLRITRAELIRKLGHGDSGHNDRAEIDLAGKPWKQVRFQWDYGPDHVSRVALVTGAPVKAFYTLRQKLNGLLPRRWGYGVHYPGITRDSINGEWHWREARLYFLKSDYRHDLELAISSYPSSEDDKAAGVSKVWQRQVSLLWDVVRVALWDRPIPLDAQAIRRNLGGGWSMSELATLGPEVTVEQKDAVLRRFFAGVHDSTLMPLTSANLPIDHPWIDMARYSWQEMRGGKVNFIDFHAPRDTRFKDPTALVRCVQKTFAIKGEDLSNPRSLNPEFDWWFDIPTGGSVHIKGSYLRVDFSGHSNHPAPRATMSQAIWVKVLGLLQSCPQTPPTPAKPATPSTPAAEPPQRQPPSELPSMPAVP